MNNWCALQCFGRVTLGNTNDLSNLYKFSPDPGKINRFEHGSEVNASNINSWQDVEGQEAPEADFEWAEPKLDQFRPIPCCTTSTSTSIPCCTTHLCPRQQPTNKQWAGQTGPIVYKYRALYSPSSDPTKQDSSIHLVALLYTKVSKKDFAKANPCHPPSQIKGDFEWFNQIGPIPPPMSSSTTH